MKRDHYGRSNPLLSDRAAFERAVIRTVATSTAVETGEDWKALERAMLRSRRLNVKTKR